MDEDPRPWEYGGSLRKLAALLVAVLFITSAVWVMGTIVACGTFILLMIIVVFLVVYKPTSVVRGGPVHHRTYADSQASIRKGETEEEEAAAINAWRREQDRMADRDATSALHVGKSEEGTGLTRNSGRGRMRRGGRKGRRRRTLRCPDCNGTRLVYEAGYMIGQVYYCKDCQYRGSFVIDYDPVREPEDKSGAGKGGKDEDGEPGTDPFGSSPPEDELPGPPILQEIQGELAAGEEDENE